MLLLASMRSMDTIDTNIIINDNYIIYLLTFEKSENTSICHGQCRILHKFKYLHLYIEIYSQYHNLCSKFFLN